MIDEHFDIIIIGSGAGGLTSASFTAQNGYKVLVLEQHSKPGGYLHGFSRKGFFFDSAVYSIAGCGQNGFVRFLLKKLGIENDLNFIEYKSIYKAKLPFGEFTLPTGVDNFKSYLANLFPFEVDNLKSMIKEMIYLYEIIELEKFGTQNDEKKVFQTLQKWGKKSYKEFVDNFIKDEKLRQIFYSMWLFCSLPEDKTSSLYAVLMFTVHILESTHYIKGGCDKLAELLIDYIKNNNGKVIFKSLVEEIIIKDGLATGVKLLDGKIYYGKVIIANSSAKNTLTKMINDTSSISGIVRRRIEKLDPSISTFALYIAVKIKNNVKSPFDESNQIFYLENDDNNKIYETCLDENYSPFQNLLITEIPSIQKNGFRTYNIYSLMSINRTKDWKEAKKQLTLQILEKIKKIIGEYFEKIVVIESGTPKTFYRYTLNEDGAMYGFENTCDPYKGAKLDNKVGIKNLFLSGHWTQSGGSVYNAMTSGYNAFKLADSYINK